MKYLITFEPDNRYFFGDSHGYNDTYIVSSKKIPPLSTVLGALRRTILVQNNILHFEKSDKHIEEKIKLGSEENIKAYIGDFDYNYNKGGNLGKIQSISPIFILRKSDNKRFIKLPLNWQSDGKDYVQRKISQKQIESNFCGTQTSDYLTLQGYIAKLGSAEIWVSSDEWTKTIMKGKLAESDKANYLLSDDIFVTHKQPGIRRGNRKSESRIEYVQSSEEQQYFQKVDYSFKKSNYCFGVIIDTSDMEIKDTGVFMGGDRSFFYMKSKAIQDSNPDEIMQALQCPTTTLVKDKLYAVLSDTNINHYRSNSLYIMNCGYLENQRRLVLPRTASVNNQLTIPRMRIKGEVVRTLPFGTLIYVNRTYTLPIGYNINAGYDRFIQLQGE